MINKKIQSILLSGLLSMGIVTTGYLAFNKQVVLVVDGQEKEVTSFKSDVKGVLDENNINYDSNDKISADLDASLEHGMIIEVEKVERKEETQTSTIDYETIVKEDNTLEEGKSKVIQEGKIGIKEMIYEVIYYDGNLASRTLMEETVKEKPQNQIIVKGTKEKEVETVTDNSITVTDNSTTVTTNSKNSSSQTSSLGTKMVVSASAYSGDGITATGTVPKWGTIAVDPTIIPYGTKVYIPQFDQYFIAEDCGGAIKGNKIDIFMNSESQCINWGRRTIDIYIVK